MEKKQNPTAKKPQTPKVGLIQEVAIGNILSGQMLQENQISNKKG